MKKSLFALHNEVSKITRPICHPKIASSSRKKKKHKHLVPRNISNTSNFLLLHFLELKVTAVHFWFEGLFCLSRIKYLKMSI